MLCLVRNSRFALHSNGQAELLIDFTTGGDDTHHILQSTNKFQAMDHGHGALSWDHRRVPARDMTQPAWVSYMRKQDSMSAW